MSIIHFIWRRPLLVLALALVLMLPTLFLSNVDVWITTVWMQDFSAKGIAAFSERISDYQPIYLYLWHGLVYLADAIAPAEHIVNAYVVAWRSVTVLGELFLVFTCYKFLKEACALNKNHALMGAVVIGIAPSILMNATWWGQSDAYYCAFVVLSVNSLLLKNYKSSMLWWGVAFALKLQSIFIAPLFLIVWLRDLRNEGGLRIGHAPLAIVPFFLLGIPVFILSQHPELAWGNYLSLPGAYPHYTLGTPTIYALFVSNLYGTSANVTLAWLGLVATTFVLLLTSVIAAYGKRSLLETALLILLLIFFLPKMHERYFLIAEVFAFLLAFSKWPSKGMLLIPIVLQIAVIPSYLFFLLHNVTPEGRFFFIPMIRVGAAIIGLMILFLLARQFIKKSNKPWLQKLLALKVD